jgi:uncharacterized protein YfaS (alpha-2-macroglobulin family)
MRLAFGVWLWPLFIAARAASAPTPATPVPVLEILRYDVAANRDTPELCFLLSQTIARQPGVALETFVSADPTAKLTATPRNNRLCLTGFVFGGRYTLSLKAGLPGVSGVLAKDAQYKISIPDRPPELSFTAPDGDILPRASPAGLPLAGLPIRSVNVPKIAVDIFHISDRDFLSGMSNPNSKDKVWQGVIEPKGADNTDTLTVLPFDGTIGAPKPGLYLAMARPSEMPATQTGPAQSFMVTDLGLTAYRGPSNLVVAVRSLATAQPVAGVDVALIARNNREIGRVRSDANGLSRFDPALLHGTGGDRPVAIYAYGAAGDFSALNLKNTVSSDNNASKATVANFFPDRSLYRPGERAQLILLLRNDHAAAIVKQPLTIGIYRPDGVLFDTRTLNDTGGGYALNLDLPNSNAAGSWRIEARLAPDGVIVGSARLDIVNPPASSLDFSIGKDTAVIDPAQPGPVEVQGEYAGGQVAANVPGEMRVTLTAPSVPFPSFSEYAFGLAEETLVPVRSEPARFGTDATGRANLPLKLPPIPNSTKPLEASIAVTLRDPGGGAIEHTLSIPLANQNFLLGIRPGSGSPDLQDPVFPEGGVSHFDVVALSPDGARQERQAVGWEIIRQDFAPSWQVEADRLTYRPSLESSHIAGGVIDVPLAAPAGIDANLPSGRYRIETFDPKGEAISSLRFRVGSTPTQAGEKPDTVEVKTGKASYAPGETADIFIKPPYEADILLVSGNPDIRDIAAQHVPPAGATLQVEIPRDATNDFQLAATAFAPPQSGPIGFARRAIGTGSIAVGPAARKLDIHLDTPEKTAPQQSLSIPVAVEGAGEEPAFVIVTATDERMAGDSPAEAAYPPAKTIKIDDIYDRIVTPSGLSNGPAPAQKNADAQPGQASQEDRPKKETKPLSYSSGIVALDKTGKAAIDLPIPDFEGKLHIRAIGWSATRLGEADSAVEVHFPLSAKLRAPDYLAPEDRADLMLAIDNIDGPRGEYRIEVTAEGAVSVPDRTEITANLAEREQRAQPIALQAHGPGEGTIKISVQGPGGIAFDRTLGIAVRAPAAIVSRHAILSLKPGAMLSIDPSMTAGLRPDTVTISLSIGNGFDLYGLAQELNAGDYGSVEQIAGHAAPYLVPAALFQTLGLARSETQVRDILEDSVRRLFALQEKDGGFSQWGKSESDPGLTAYAIDFLSRAKAAGIEVPAEPFRLALDFLTTHAESAQQSLEDAAYIQKILAANGRLTIFQLRYFADKNIGAMHSQLAIGTLGAAFAALNEKDAAAAFFAQALALPSAVGTEGGQEFHNQAMLTALMAESGIASQSSLVLQAGKMATASAAHRQFAVQEATWFFRAQAALAASASGKIKLKAGDKTIDQTEPYTAIVHPGDAGLAQIKNLGDAPLRVALTVAGIPIQAEFKDGTGYELQRWFFDTTGKPVDPATIRENDLMVVVLTGRFTGEGEARPLLIDPISAGWQVEAASLSDPTGRYPWLKDLTGAGHIGVEKGRYIAVPVLAGDRHEFKLAYVVRAARRGQFAMPGSIIEDMAQPNLSARGVNGRTKIDPAF